MFEQADTLDVLSVSDITQHVKRTLDNEAAIQNVWVQGEVSNFSQPSSGHMYFTLKDDRSSLRVVMFRSRARHVHFGMEDGLTVLIRGSVSVYEAAGSYQLYAEEMQPAGQGALHLAFEQLKKKLDEEGLFAQKRSIPYFPRHIGIITSPTGAAVRDMISVIRRRNKAVNILLIPAVVQGEHAVPSLCQAIETAQQVPYLDVLIIGRGGGSLEELWAFNEEEVARALYRSRIPTISAVGHETDFTIADFVADRRAPTPSVAAELAVPEIHLLQSALRDLEHRAAGTMRQRIHIQRDRLRLLQESAVLTKPERFTREARQRLDELTVGLERAIQSRVEQHKQKLQLTVAQLDSLSPLATLSRGYAICTRATTNDIVRDAHDVQHGEALHVQVANGTIPCRVVKNKETKAKQEHNTEQKLLPIDE